VYGGSNTKLGKYLKTDTGIQQSQAESSRGRPKNNRAAFATVSLAAAVWKDTLKGQSGAERT